MNSYTFNKSIVGFANILILIFCFFDVIFDKNIFQIVKDLYQIRSEIFILLALPLLSFVSLVLVFLDNIKVSLIIYSTFFAFMLITALYLMIMVDQVAMIFNLFGLGIYSIFVCLLISIIFSLRSIKIHKSNQKSDVEVSTVGDNVTANLDD
tara:strand:- start:9833 stop:10288 length:456 start_codon:yes stop_codon:yes gene_type:complete